MCPRASHKAPRAFTLLEVIVATMIVGMITLALHRFLSTNLRAISFTTDLTAEREALQSVVRLLEAQLHDLPASAGGVRRAAPAAPGVEAQAAALPAPEFEPLKGRALKFRGLSNDEITWRCTAGAGLLTTAAPGEWRVTLTVQPVNDQSGETELGLRRSPIDPKAPLESGALDRGTGTDAYHWLPLMRPMAALEIRYFDASLNAWQDAWADPNRRPHLVRVRLWKRAADAPFEAVLTVPASRLQP